MRRATTRGGPGACARTSRALRIAPPPRPPAPPGTPRYVARGLVSPFLGLFKGAGFSFTFGHGFGGWLPTTQADPRMVFEDVGLLKLVASAMSSALREHFGNPLLRLATHFDPNDRRNASGVGVAFTPLAGEKGKRAGPREYLLRVKRSKKHGKNLTIK